MIRRRRCISSPLAEAHTLPEVISINAHDQRIAGNHPKSQTQSIIGWLALMMMTLLVAAACNASPTPTPTPVATPLPDLELNPTGGSVRASGNIEPAQKAELAFPTAGRVERVAVEVGEMVTDGSALVVLEATPAEAAVEQARSTLFQARANLEDIADGARPQEIEIARTRLDAAEARLAQLAESARPDEVAAAEAELNAARAAYRQLFNGPRESERVDALVELSNAKAALQQAQSAYDRVSWSNDVGALPESRQLQEATNNLEAAQANYDALFAAPDADRVAEAEARIQQAAAALDRLLNPGSENQVAEAAAQVRSAQAELDLLTAGARNGEIAAAAMAVAQAEASLKSAQAALDNMTLQAPFAGVVTAIEISPGETVQSGQSVLTLADLDHLRMETTDLSERDVARVAVGQPATVFVKPLNEEFPGHVVQIAPQASVIGGDVVYTVIIALDQQPPNLRWGMSADVEIAGE